MPFKSTQATAFLFLKVLLFIALLAHRKGVIADSTSAESKRNETVLKTLETAPLAALTTRDDSEERGVGAGNFFKKILLGDNVKTTLEGLRRDLPTSYVEASTLLREAAATKVEATVSNLKEIDYAKKFRNAKQVVQREATNLKAAANKLLQSVDYDNDLRWAKEVVQSINKNGGVESTVGMHESLFSKWDANKVREQLFSKWKKHLVRAGTLRQEFIQRDGRIKDDEGFEKLIFRAYEIYLGKTKLKGDEDIASTSKTL